MRKEYFAGIFSAALMMSAALVSCGEPHMMTEDELPKLITSPKVTEPPVIVAADETEETLPPEPDTANTEAHLKRGTWFSYNESESSYYFFEDDGASGSKVSVKTGISMPFRYEKTEGEDQYIFHLNYSDNNTKASVQFTDNDHAVISMENALPDHLSYISAQSFKEFVFYTDEELVSMAERRYRNTQEKPVKDEIKLSVITKEDASAIIQIYKTAIDPKTEKETDSVLEIYTVDRMSAVGTDAAGNYTDLSM